MNANEQVVGQLERAIRKVAEKFPQREDGCRFTDIHLRISQESGDLTVFDDEDAEITRCVIEQWIDNKEENFYPQVVKILRHTLDKNRSLLEAMSIMKPFSFVLEDNDGESIEEVYLVDDDLVIVSEELMAGLDKDLDDFFAKLMKE